MRDGIKTGTGNTKWWDSTINGILTNEKYHGDVLLQKTYTVDFLNHKRVRNNGIAQQYYIEQNHEPIISKEMFDKVQDEKERRALLKGNLVGDRHKYTSKYPFSGKVFCGNCGNIFKRRTWNSNCKYKKVVWQCKTYVMDGKEACDAKAVDESVLQDAFVRMFNKINENKSEFIATLMENIEEVLAVTTSNQVVDEVDSKIEVLKEDLKGLVKLQVRNQIDDAVYNEEYERIYTELGELREQRAELDRQNNIGKDYKERLNVIIETLNSWQGLLVEFSDEIFNALVEKIEISSPTHFVFVLKSGMRVEENITL